MSVVISLLFLAAGCVGLSEIGDDVAQLQLKAQKSNKTGTYHNELSQEQVIGFVRKSSGDRRRREYFCNPDMFSENDNFNLKCCSDEERYGSQEDYLAANPDVPQYYRVYKDCNSDDDDVGGRRRRTKKCCKSKDTIYDTTTTTTTTTRAYNICSTSTADNVADVVFPLLVTAFNVAWPTIASNEGLDPWENVFDLTEEDDIINDACYGFCTAVVAVSEGGKIKLDMSEMKGLGSIALDDIDTSDMTIDDNDNSCKAVTNSSCSYLASMPVTGYLLSGHTLKGTFSEATLECRCSRGFEQDDLTPVDLSGTSCKSTDAKVKGTLKACVSFCDGGVSGVVSGIINSAEIEDLKISDSSDFSCTGGAWYFDVLAPVFKAPIYAAINDPIKDALNDALDKLIGDGLPSGSC